MTTKKDYAKVAHWCFFDDEDDERLLEDISGLSGIDIHIVDEFISFVLKAIDELPDDPKPCPFCGSNDGVGYIRTCGSVASVSTECKNCEAEGPKATKLDDESWEQVEMEALELWNKRYEQAVDPIKPEPNEYSRLPSCPVCHSHLDRGAKYCASCGAKLSHPIGG